MYLRYILPDGNDLGMMACLLSSVNILMEFPEDIVYVDFRKNCVYKDYSLSEHNVWDYYFYQPKCDFDKFNFECAKTIWLGEINYCFGFFNGRPFENREITKMANKVLKSITVKKNVTNKIFSFYNEKMSEKKILGVQCRGTDTFNYGHAHGQKFGFDDAVRYVDGVINGYDSLFLVTDEKKILDKFRNKYPDLIHYDDAILSEDGNAIHVSEGNKYKKGEDVIVETWLLSMCNYLLAMASNISTVARILNPDLPYEFIDKNIYYS